MELHIVAGAGDVEFIREIILVPVQVLHILLVLDFVAEADILVAVVLAEDGRFLPQIFPHFKNT